MPEDDDAGPRVPLGPVGRYVIENLKQLREARKLSYRELSDRLRTLGRPIATLGLSRIEKGNRRVDADDLVALAVALDVSPTALLLPRAGAPGDEIQVTPDLTVAAVAAWEWSAGRIPLPPGDVTWQRFADFEMNTRPVWHGSSVVKWRNELERRKAEMERIQRDRELSFRNHHPLEDELQPVVATAIVTSEQGVLLGRRHDGKPPWTFIAGECEAGEQPEDAAEREVKEEAGLEVRIGERIGERVHPKTGRTMVYLASHPVRGTAVFVGDADELAEVRWVSLGEADELMQGYGMFGPVREYLARELGEE